MQKKKHEESTVRKFRTVQIEGDIEKEREIKHYSLQIVYV